MKQTPVLPVRALHRLPYAVAVGLIVLLIFWWLRDLESAVGLALAGFTSAALVPTPTWPGRGDRAQQRRT